MSICTDTIFKYPQFIVNYTLTDCNVANVDIIPSIIFALWSATTWQKKMFKNDEWWFKNYMYVAV